MGDPIIDFSDSTWSVQVFDGASSIYKTCFSPIPLLGIDIEALLHEECIVWSKRSGRDDAEILFECNSSCSR